jgi:hypothetical protein
MFALGDRRRYQIAARYRLSQRSLEIRARKIRKHLCAIPYRSLQRMARGRTSRKGPVKERVGSFAPECTSGASVKIFSSASRTTAASRGLWPEPQR